MQKERTIVVASWAAALVSLTAISRATDASNITGQVLLRLDAEDQGTMGLYYFGQSLWRAEMATLDFRKVWTHKGAETRMPSFCETLGMRRTPPLVRLMRSQYAILEKSAQLVAKQEPIALWGPRQEIYRSDDGILIIWDRDRGMPVITCDLAENLVWWERWTPDLQPGASLW